MTEMVVLMTLGFFLAQHGIDSGQEFFEGGLVLGFGVKSQQRLGIAGTDVKPVA